MFFDLVDRTFSSDDNTCVVAGVEELYEDSEAYKTCRTCNLGFINGMRS